MNFYYCLSFSETVDGSCMLFKNLAWISRDDEDQWYQIAITETEITAGNIQFNNGITRGGEIWEWVKTGITERIGQSIELRDIEIALHGPDKMLFIWMIKDARPVSYQADEAQWEVKLNNLEFSYNTLLKIYP
jgi:hypothetical protein